MIFQEWLLFLKNNNKRTKWKLFVKVKISSKLQETNGKEKGSVPQGEPSFCREQAAGLFCGGCRSFWLRPCPPALLASPSKMNNFTWEHATNVQSNCWFSTLKRRISFHFSLNTKTIKLKLWTMQKINHKNIKKRRQLMAIMK